MKLNVLIFFGVCMVIFIFTIFTNPVFASLDIVKDGLNVSAQKATLITDPSNFNARENLNNIITNLIRVVLGLVGTVFLILIFVAGQLWMNAGGNEEQVTKARSIMTAAIIGLAITLGTYIITNFIINELLGVVGA